MGGHQSTLVVSHSMSQKAMRVKSLEPGPRQGPCLSCSPCLSHSWPSPTRFLPPFPGQIEFHPAEYQSCVDMMLGSGQIGRCLIQLSLMAGQESFFLSHNLSFCFQPAGSCFHGLGLPLPLFSAPVCLLKS